MSTAVGATFQSAKGREKMPFDSTHVCPHFGTNGLRVLYTAIATPGYESRTPGVTLYRRYTHPITKIGLKEPDVIRR
jgi:hypothetical protein